MQTLIINAHPDPQNKTAYCTNRLVDCLTKKLPDATVLNLYNEDIPELTAETLPVFNGAYSGDGKDAELSKGAQHFLARNAELLEQFKAADRVIIAMPMHNFTVTSRLKDYLDNIIVPGQTFQYTREGPQGLMGGHKARLCSQAAPYTAPVRWHRGSNRTPSCRPHLGCSGSIQPILCVPKAPWTQILAQTSLLSVPAPSLNKSCPSSLPKKPRIAGYKEHSEARWY